MLSFHPPSQRNAVKCFSKLASSSRRGVPLIRMLYPRINVNRKATFTFSYMQTITLYQLSDETLNGSYVFLHFSRCGLLSPHPPHLRMLSAPPSSFFKQSSNIGIGSKIVKKGFYPNSNLIRASSLGVLA